MLVLTWAGNDCDYLGWAGREWPETAESVFKSEPELRSGNNKNWCDLVTGGLGMVMVTMTGRGIMGHAPSLCSGKHQTPGSHTHKQNRSIIFKSFHSEDI